MTLQEIKAAEEAGLKVVQSSAHGFIVWRGDQVVGEIFAGSLTVHDQDKIPAILRILAGEQCAFFNNVGRLPALPYPTEDK